MLEEVGVELAQHEASLTTLVRERIRQVDMLEHEAAEEVHGLTHLVRLADVRKVRRALDHVGHHARDH